MRVVPASVYDAGADFDFGFVLVGETDRAQSARRRNRGGGFQQDDGVLRGQFVAFGMLKLDGE